MRDSSDRNIDRYLDELASEEMDLAQTRLLDTDRKDLFRNGEKPVDIMQFCDDPQYLGSQVKAEPRIRELLWLIEKDGVQEIFTEVGKGSGKSFVGSIFPVYGVYKLLMLRRPQLVFGLAPATILATINVSISRVQAKDVIFHQIKELIQKSPWFQNNAAYTSLTQELKFKGRNITLYCGHSNSTAFLGFATYRGVLDETNFMINNVNRNVAEDLFSALKGSCKTRFPHHYKLLCISSCATPGAWLHQEVDRVMQSGKELALTPGGLPASSSSGVDGESRLDSILDGVFEETT